MPDFYSYILPCISFTEPHCCLHRFRNHVLMYVYSGELEIIIEGQSLFLRSGQGVFIASGQLAHLAAVPHEGEEAHAILILPRSFLCEFYYTLDCRHEISYPSDEIGVLLLPTRPDMASLFQSLVPYHKTAGKMPHKLLRLKMAEAIYALLNTDRRFLSTLFNFAGVVKLNLLDILNETEADIIQWQNSMIIPK